MKLAVGTNAIHLKATFTLQRQVCNRQSRVTDANLYMGAF